MEIEYDIFETLPNGESKLHSNCLGLEAAIAATKKLAAVSTNDFVIMNLATSAVVAKLPRGVVKLMLEDTALPTQSFNDASFTELASLRIRFDELVRLFKILLESSNTPNREECIRLTKQMQTVVNEAKKVVAANQKSRLVRFN